MSVPEGMIQCSMNHRLYTDNTLGIWDDGEWVSWDYINEHVEDWELQKEYPNASLELVHNFHALVEVAIDYKQITGRYLDIWGELGEFYAEVKYGLKRHRAHAPGSDGRIGNDFYEVKTISPMKSRDRVEVKCAGNFSKLIIVKVDTDYSFDSKVIQRNMIRQGAGKVARVNWGDSGDK